MALVTSIAAVLLGSLTSCRKQTAEPSSAKEPVGTGTTAASTSASSSKNVDDTLRSLLSAWDKVEAFSANLKVNAKREVGERAFSEGEAKYNFARRDQSFRVRYLAKSMINFYLPAETSRYITAEFREFVTDGTLLEHLTIQRGHRQLVRKRYDPQDMLQLGGRPVIDPIREHCTIKSMTPFHWEGRDAIRLECQYKDHQGSAHHSFDVQTGIRIGWVERDADGEEILSIKIESLDLSPAFSDADFEFEAKFIEFTLVDETGPERAVIPWESIPQEIRSRFIPPKDEPSAPQPRSDDSSDSTSTSSEPADHDPE